MTLLSKFNQQCNNNPNSTAFIEGEQTVSYRQAHFKTQQLSHLLLTKHNKIDRIAIALDRGIDAAIAILATLNIAACYIPVDIKNPTDRSAYIIKDADVQCVIGLGPCPDWLENSERWLDITRLDGDSLPSQYKSINKPEDLAAILYTSGSTGTPKGVALSHKAINNFSVWAADTFQISPQDNIASLAPFHFDLSTFDLFSSLSRGASIHFIPGNLTFSPSRLTAWLSKHKISVWYTIPSLLSFIALKGALSSTPLPALRTVLFAGEVFPTPQLIKLCQLLPNVDFYNLYGPTETNVCCYWPVDRGQLESTQAIPIGIPACDSELIIDKKNKELLVKSNNNLSGYWRQGKLQTVALINNYYATGDKVSINDQGEYCYHGRLDRMLKCSGYRVEPAEIEHIILQCNEVKQCAVIGIKDSTSGQRPAAALVLINNANLADLVKKIRSKLPAYMQPSNYLVFDSLPTLSNGKIDYPLLQTQLEKS